MSEITTPSESLPQTVPAAPASPPNTPSATPPSTAAIPPDMAALIESVRQEERLKAKAEIDAAKAAAAENEALAEQARKEARDLKAKTDPTAAALEQLEELRIQNAAREAQRIADQQNYEKQLAEVKVQAYREKRTLESGILPELAELVTGGTKAEVEASIQSTLSKQAAIIARSKESTRAASAANVPSPVSPSSTSNVSVVSRMSQHAAARLPPEQFAQFRAQMLDNAKRTVGLPS